jgi:hypothetical protein
MTCDWSGPVQATTVATWLKVSVQSQHDGMADLMATHRAIEMLVEEKVGIPLTIAQLRDAGVYEVRYDEESDRYLHEVFAPFGIDFEIDPGGEQWP